jgi:hypothetical protein
MPALSPPRYLFRALRSDEMPERPPAYGFPRIRPTNPDAKQEPWDVIDAHGVGGESQFIHCSPDRFVALYFATVYKLWKIHTGCGTVVCLDTEELRKSGAIVHDMRPGGAQKHGHSSEDNCYAAKHEIFLIEGVREIPRSAVVGWFDGFQLGCGGYQPRDFCSFDRFKSELRPEVKQQFEAWLGQPQLVHKIHTVRTVKKPAASSPVRKETIEERVARQVAEHNAENRSWNEDRKVIQKHSDDANIIAARLDRAASIVATFNEFIQFKFKSESGIFIARPTADIQLPADIDRAALVDREEAKKVWNQDIWNTNTGWSMEEELMDALSHFSYGVTSLDKENTVRVSS